MPFHEDTKLLDWGHLYGDIEFPLEEAYLPGNSPWRDGIVPRRVEIFTTSDPITFDTRRSANCVKPSWNTSPPENELELLSSAIVPIIRRPPRGKATRSDCFAEKLDLDTLLMIAAHLPLTDILNACIVSPAFSQVLDFQKFWHTRFQPGGERHWFFEVRRTCLPDGHYMDWRELFANTRKAALTPPLLNRRRIWNLIPNILEATSVSWEGRSPRPTDWIADDSNS